MYRFKLQRNHCKHRGKAVLEGNESVLGNDVTLVVWYGENYKRA